MNSRHKIKRRSQFSKPDQSSSIADRQVRSRQAILGLAPPALLVGVGNDLVLDLLGAGYQADICDASLARIERLVRACRERGLEAEIYWQSLAYLQLPDRYRNIVLAPACWHSLIDGQQALRAQQQLDRLLEPKGQLWLLIESPARSVIAAN